MTLVGRTSAFFLGVLALALVTFSVALYLVGRAYLYKELDERLEAALVTLSATVDVKPRGLEWGPEERQIRLGVDAGPEHVRWAVYDGNGKPIVHSENLQGSERAAMVEAVSRSGHAASLLANAASNVSLEGQTWRVLSLRLQAQRPSGARNVRSDLKETDNNQDDHEDEQEALYPALILTAGLSTRPAEHTLENLLIASLGLSTALWVFAACLGRWLCRRALAPLSRMATTARTMPATELHERLPLPGTRDELQDLAIAFNGLLSRFQEAFARQRRFTGEASHQLRTPLTALLGQVEVALRSERGGHEYRAVLERVQGQGQRLVRIVEMLLFLARTHAEAEMPEQEATELNDWLRQHLATWSGHPRSADFDLQSAPQDVTVRIHPELFGQLVDNLLENACRYSQAGTAITVRVARQDSKAVLEVEDRGLGMGQEDLAQLFQPFFRAAHVRHLGIDGVGLGLAVVDRIAAALGGRVQATSRLGVGSVFKVELPVFSECLRLAEETMPANTQVVT